MVRTYDPDGLRINARRAESIADAQNAQHQQALSENQAAGQVVERKAAPVLSDTDRAAQQNASLSSPSVREQGGVIAANRNARLDAANATPEQRAQNQQNLQGIMNPGYGVSPEDRRLAERLQALQNTADLDAMNLDPVSRANIEASRQNEAASIQDQLNRKNQQMQAREAASANASAASSAATDPATAGMQGLLANLPPEAQALAPFFDNILNEISAGQQQNAEMTNALLNGGEIDVNGEMVNVKGITSTYDEMEKKIADMEAGYTAMQEGIQGMLDKAKDQQDKYIAEQEEAAKERLAWQETGMLRQAAKEKQDAVDSRIARLALTGGFGSDGGLREIEETRMEYENRMDDIKVEFGIQRTDLAAKFTGLFLEASNNHLNASITNIKDTAAALERIAGQSRATKEARMNAENGVLTNFVNQQTASRKEYAGTMLNIATQMQEMIRTDKAEKLNRENAAWGRLEWAVGTYGSEIPQSLLDDITKSLPAGTDINSIAGSLTLEERRMKKTGSGGGGGLGGFANYMMQGDGTIPPTFESFLAEKEKEAFARGEPKFDTSAKAMAAYRQEFDAKFSVQNNLNPAEIVNRFSMKAGTLAGPARKYAEAQLKEYLDAGQFQLAADFVDNTGDPIPATQETDFIQALNSRYNVQKMQGLFDEIGMTYPGVGLIREMNPLDDRVIQYKQNLTQTIPALARGIFKEVGVLTDSDIERYTSSIANPNLTQAQAKNAFNDLLERINVSMQNQINVWDANGRRTKGLRDLYEAAPMSSSTNLSTQADEDYAQSILLGQ